MMSHRLVVALLFALINPVIIMPLQAIPLKDHLGKNRVIITFFSSAREPARLALKMQIEERTSVHLRTEILSTWIRSKGQRSLMR